MRRTLLLLIAILAGLPGHATKVYVYNNYQSPSQDNPNSLIYLWPTMANPQYCFFAPWPTYGSQVSVWATGRRYDVDCCIHTLAWSFDLDPNRKIPLVDSIDELIAISDAYPFPSSGDCDLEVVVEVENDPSDPKDPVRAKVNIQPDDISAPARRDWPHLFGTDEATLPDIVPQAGREGTGRRPESLAGPGVDPRPGTLAQPAGARRDAGGR